jgi:hypothetical protein
LADRETLVELTNKFSKIFPQLFVLATNPNYLFFLFKSKEMLSSDFNYQSVLKYLGCDPILASLTDNITRTLIKETPNHLR